MKTCKKCCLPEGVVYREDGAALPSIKVILNVEGICNFCNYYENNPYQPDISHPYFLKMLRYSLQNKQKPYDALIGISGGKDGCYVAYDLIKKYNLNILLFSYQLFQTAEATKKCDEFAKKLEKRYPNNITYLPFRRGNYVHEEYYKVFKKAFLATGLPCSACTILNIRLSITDTTLCSIAPLLFSGSSPEQIYGLTHPDGKSPWLIFFKKDKFNKFDDFRQKLNESLNEQMLPFFNYNSEEMNIFFNNLKSLQKEDLIKIANDEISNTEKRNRLIQAFSECTYDHNAITPISYFSFHNYDEKMIRETLKNELDYIAPPSHSDCCMNKVIKYIFNQFIPYNTKALEAAAWVRMGRMSMEEAKPIILNEKNKPYPSSEDMKNFCDFLQITREDFNATMEKTKILLSEFMNTQ